MTIRLREQVIEILKILKKKGKEYVASNLADQLDIDYIVLMAAINDLKDHNLADFKEIEINKVTLNEEGRSYLQKGLPERQLFNYLLENNIKEISLSEFLEKSCLSKQIFYVGLSNLKEDRLIAQSKATGEHKVFLLEEKFPKTDLEKFMDIFKEKNEYDYSKFTKEEKSYISLLNKRKLIDKTRRTQRIIYLTEDGKEIDMSEIEELKMISKITPKMLSDGSWKEYELKSFDVTKPGPELKAGKLHPVIQLINEIREIFLSLGFTEIRGPIVESAFFNFDALFQPQDHPARELHDTFYLDNPKTADLPEEDNVKKLRAIHEDGGGSGSTGWGYDWSEKIARQTLLRTHTTATTIRRLAKFYRNNDVPPIKVFSIDRVFRNESVDKSHLAEFMQIEGIVIGENVTLCDLIGVISEFYKKMGFEKIITRPGFFPYTEPSMEIAVYYDKLGEWLEMGGSGIFRPEVTYPWGIENPTRVLAWGLGLERLAMLRFERDDIRDLYINPIKWLRNESY
ncbi:MAG: phenylalanine--tRNA ligase subunit alpha [Promethearchaeia archaeon]